MVDRTIPSAPPPDPEPEPESSAASEPEPAAPGSPEHLADPRALTILSTEHWSLLTARSLVYNETFTRGGMFLTLLSASLVALGFVYQGGGGAGGTAFLSVVLAVLTLDLFVGLATLGRIVSASMEEFRTLQAMARIRHAYLEMVPTLDPYFSTAIYDDAENVLAVYGSELEDRAPLLNLLHGLTTMPGMIGVICSTLIGAISATVAIMFGASDGVAFAVGLLGGAVAFVAISVYALRTFSKLNRFLTIRFPPPPPSVTPPSVTPPSIP